VALELRPPPPPPPPPFTTDVIQPILLAEHPGLVLETEYCKGSQSEVLLLLWQILHKMNRSLSGF